MESLEMSKKDTKYNYKGYSDFHPRVDEFTTLRIPMSNNSILFNPNALVSFEFNAKVDVTTTVYTEYDCPGVSPTTAPPTPTTAPKSTTTFKSTAEVSADTPPTKPNPPEGSCKDGATKYTVASTLTTPTNIVLPPKRFFEEVSKEESYTVLSSTIVLTMEKGVLKKAEWDGDRNPDVCKYCGGDLMTPTVGYKCVMNQCAVASRSTNCREGAGCSLKVFVAWQGTDADDRPLISINKAPSNFVKYSFTPISQIGLGLISDFLDRIVGNTNNPNTA
ncbi:hypothetical protein SAMD00019534_057950 [Acytostelium subglobosum LB1]|uniref:hypothetical protein n=1 Tax=Acytostelium subglobosum LB1 TaxID=1410327 RepID=UPI000644AFAD|nr:hypothetical protein SAMD00019534_057950 [Acytostelium subglobosum LB1]GAM22620.1 hypothetical protein SAMD00019534_057950 [Acytostelium subglobosum LB1]|eukprot:XP_012754740.1 hypothetical protein SAMD00019534_057950 [Acytostelium subglobosum LB1]